MSKGDSETKTRRHRLVSWLRSRLRPVAPIEFYRRRVWPRLPTTAEHGTYNGVEIKGSRPMFVGDETDEEITHRLLDGVVPWNTPSAITNYKGTNIEQVRKHCQSGDHVVVVGGGHGGTAVVAAETVGPEGSVTIFEGDERLVGDIQQTLRQNGVASFCTVRHVIVGETHAVAAPAGADVIDPSALPSCDVLEMDCEGAELGILKDLTVRPRCILVELHHEKSYATYSSPDTVREELTAGGYSLDRHDGPWVDGLLAATRGSG